MVVGLHGFAHVDEVAGGQEVFVASENGRAEGNILGELRLDERIKHLQVFLRHGLARGELDEATEEALCFLLRVLGFGLHPQIIKQNAVGGGRPGL